MPHIIVEYTDTLSSSEDIPKLAFALHENLAMQETVNVHAIKTRVIPVKYVVVGDSKEGDRMIHITLKLLPGRDDGLKKTMAQGLFDTARKITHDDRISISVEVAELHAESYVQ
ncbi:MAG: hypothetical protein H6861_03885 [Rhodospirillales bacterium]|nr:hypothetical protein [Rhodospirillales bacterium]